MGFSAYILESLKRYGKAEIGPLGSFTLDYQPAHWSIAHQYFTPPKSRIIWSPDPGTGIQLDMVASSVSRLHETSKAHSLEFVHQTIDQLKAELEQNHEIDFGILGRFYIPPSTGKIEFKQSPDLEAYLAFTPLSIKPLPVPVKTKEFPVWMIYVLMFGLLLAFIWIVFFFQASVPLEATAVKTEQAIPQSMKGVNMAPSLKDTLSSQPESTTSLPIPEERIIITGTFCKPANIRKMKEKIEYLQYRIYEEFMDENCVRLGIYLYAQDDLQSSLEDIRKFIEPQAWVLN